MPSLAARLARLEAARPVPNDAEADQARRHVVEKLAEYAEGFHAEDMALAAGQPRKGPVSTSRSPAENVVRAAMDDASQDGPWDSPAYVGTFWKSVERRLLALVRARQAAQDGAAGLLSAR